MIQINKRWHFLEEQQINQLNQMRKIAEKMIFYQNKADRTKEELTQRCKLEKD